MKIIIAGAYAIGTHLAQLLSRNNEDTVLIDSDEERLASISSEYDLMTVHASTSRIQTLKDAGVSGADLFIAVTRDENLNMNACMLAKALGAKRTTTLNILIPSWTVSSRRWASRHVSTLRTWQHEISPTD